MFRTALTVAALSGFMIGGAQAQTAPAADTANQPATSAPAGDHTPAMPGTATAPVNPGPGSATTDEGWMTTDLAAVSTDDLVGADLVNVQNEEIATIDDVLITDTKVEGIVVTFGGMLGFGAQKVLLKPEEVEVMQDGDQNLRVRTNLTPEAIESRPAYEES